MPVKVAKDYSYQLTIYNECILCLETDSIPQPDVSIFHPILVFLFPSLNMLFFLSTQLMRIWSRNVKETGRSHLIRLFLIPFSFLLMKFQEDMVEKSLKRSRMKYTHSEELDSDDSDSDFNFESGGDSESDNESTEDSDESDDSDDNLSELAGGLISDCDL